MARILVYQSPSSGNVFPAVDMLLELHGRGHELHLRGGASEVERMGALGIQAGRVDSRIEEFEFDDWRGRSQIDALRRMLRAYATLAELELPDLREAIAEVQPDALVVDVNCHGAMYVAEASGLPWAVFCPYPPAFRSADAPPHGFGWRPARGRLGRMRDRIWWGVGDRLGRRELATVQQAEDRSGLSADRDIGRALPEVRHLHRLHRGAVRVPAPAIGRRRPASSGRGSGSRRPGRRPGSESETRPIVLVTASTAYQRDDKLIATALEALAERARRRRRDDGRARPERIRAPPNARIEAFLPHGLVLERAACVVCHGGHGITVKAAQRRSPGLRGAVLP